MRGHTIRKHERRSVLVAVLVWLALSPQPGRAQGAATPPGDLTDTRAAFLQMIERPRMPLAPQSRALPAAEGRNAVFLTRITDAHGNYITITYRNNQGPHLETITEW